MRPCTAVRAGVVVPPRAAVRQRSIALITSSWPGSQPGIGAAPRRSVITEDVRDLQPWTGHDGPTLRGRLMLRLSS